MGRKKPTKNKGGFKYHCKIKLHCRKVWSVGMLLFEKDWNYLSLQDTTPLSSPAEIITGTMVHLFCLHLGVKHFICGISLSYHKNSMKKVWLMLALYKYGNKKTRSVFSRSHT